MSKNSLPSQLLLTSSQTFGCYNRDSHEDDANTGTLAHTETHFLISSVAITETLISLTLAAGALGGRAAVESSVNVRCGSAVLVRIRLKLTIWCTLVILLASRSTEPYGNLSNLIRVKLIIHQFMQHIGTNYVRHVGHGNFISVK